MTANMWQNRKNNLLALWLDFDADSYYVTHKFERTSFGDKIAVDGGTLGLFLGFSFLGVLDILFWALEKFLTIFRIIKKKI